MHFHNFCDFEQPVGTTLMWYLALLLHQTSNSTNTVATTTVRKRAPQQWGNNSKNDKIRQHILFVKGISWAFHHARYCFSGFFAKNMQNWGFSVIWTNMIIQDLDKNYGVKNLGFWTFEIPPPLSQLSVTHRFRPEIHKCSFKVGIVSHTILKLHDKK